MMSPKQMTIILGAVLLVLSVAEAMQKNDHKGKGHWGGKNHTMMCKGEPMKAKGLWKGRKQCAEKYVPMPDPMPEDEEEKREAMRDRWMQIKNNTCVAVCHEQALGVFDESGAFNQEAANDLIEANFPEKVHEEMKEGLQTCASEYMEGKVMTINEEDKCEDYKDVIHCMRERYFEICEIKRHGKHHRHHHHHHHHHHHSSQEASSTPAPAEE